MNRSSKWTRCAAVLLVCGCCGLATQARPIDQLPANTLGFVTWNEPIERHQLKQITTWIQDTIKALPFEEHERADLEPLSEGLDFVRLLLGGKGAIGAVELATADGEIEVYGVGRFELGDLAPRAMQLLESLLKNGGNTVERITIDGRSYQRSQSECKESMIFSAEDGLMTLVIGPENIEGLVTSLEHVDLSVADSELYKISVKKVGAVKEPIFTFFLDVERVMARVQQAFESGPELSFDPNVVLAETGLGAIRSVYCTVEADDQSNRSRLFIATKGARVGLLKLWDLEPLSTDDIALIPLEARCGAAIQFDAKMFYDELMRVLREVAPEAAAVVGGGMGAVQGATNVSLPDDLFPALGDTWVFYDTPDAGGFIFTGVTMVADVRDRQALRDIFGRLIEFATPLLQQANITPQVLSLHESGKKIEYLVLSGLPIPVAPAACFVKDAHGAERVIVGLSPQVVKLAIPQTIAKKPPTSVLDHPDVKPLVGKLPKNMQGFYYADNHASLRDFYWISHLLATAATSIAPNDDFNPGMLPTLPEQLDLTRNAVSYSSADEDGLLFAADNQFIPILSQATSIGSAGIVAAVMVPSFARAREQARETVSMVNLHQIAIGYQAYWAEHSEPPESLEVLVKQNMIPEKALTSPRTPAGQQYVYIPQPADNNPQNVLAYEPVVAGTTVIAFTDGHAQRATEEELRTALAETAKRLGRELEVVMGE